MIRKLGAMVVVGFGVVCAVCAVSAQKPALQHTEFGQIQRHYIYSPQMRDTIPVDVWTPEGYDSEEASTVRYPVIYMHDGQNLYDAGTTWNHQAWEVDSIATSLIRNGVINAPIVVGIHSDARTRVATLMPTKGVAEVDITKSDLPQIMSYQVPMGDEYVAFMAETVKPLIDSEYRTCTDRLNTYVAGSSMGGLMSMYAICERPDIFGGAMCLSTHWSGTEGITDEFAASLLHYMERTLPSPAQYADYRDIPRLYFDHGTTTIDAGYGPYQQKVNEMLLRKGYDPAHLMTYVAEGAPHEERAWAARFALPLIFMLHK